MSEGRPIPERSEGSALDEHVALRSAATKGLLVSGTGAFQKQIPRSLRSLGMTGSPRA
jgi:hypothetical protein